MNLKPATNLTLPLNHKLSYLIKNHFNENISQRTAIKRKVTKDGYALAEAKVGNALLDSEQTY